MRNISIQRSVTILFNREPVSCPCCDGDEEWTMRWLIDSGKVLDSYSGRQAMEEYLRRNDPPLTMRRIEHISGVSASINLAPEDSLYHRPHPCEVSMTIPGTGNTPREAYQNLIDMLEENRENFLMGMDF